jgi:hypothetical protein
MAPLNMCSTLSNYLLSGLENLSAYCTVCDHDGGFKHQFYHAAMLMSCTLSHPDDPVVVRLLQGSLAGKYSPNYLTSICILDSVELTRSSGYLVHNK